MQITFNTIESVHKLLTSTEWIDKHNPAKRLEKLNQDLAIAKTDKEKQKIQRAIEGVQKTIKPGEKFGLDLKSVRIGEDDARALLANINLLDNKQELYNQEACDALSKLLENDFDKLNTKELYEITDKIRIPEYPKTIAPLNLNQQQVYEQVLPYCRIIANMYNGVNDELNPIELANKLSGYFANIDDAKAY